MFDLQGPVTIVNATEVQRDFGKVITKVSRQDVVIVRNNEPVAAMIPVKKLKWLQQQGAGVQKPSHSVQHFIDALQNAPAKIRNNFLSVILYGSYARGEETSKSDIDLLVIVKKLNSEWRQILSEWSTDAMEKTGYEDFLVAMPMSQAHWKQLKKSKALLAKEVEKDGIVLWKN